mmetsp:Transcript_25667/g.46340  ORF Transcript_25667/g.46340 Transcript_25667/m.46340 type:complete len:371 (+) Transcript_25667:519-1631(+)
MGVNKTLRGPTPYTTLCVFCINCCRPGSATPLAGHCHLHLLVSHLVLHNTPQGLQLSLHLLELDRQSLHLLLCLQQFLGNRRFVGAGFLQLQLNVPEATAPGHVQDSVSVHISASGVSTIGNEPSCDVDVVHPHGGEHRAVPLRVGLVHQPLRTIAQGTLDETQIALTNPAPQVESSNVLIQHAPLGGQGISDGLVAVSHGLLQGAAATVVLDVGVSPIGKKVLDNLVVSVTGSNTERGLALSRQGIGVTSVLLDPPLHHPYIPLLNHEQQLGQVSILNLLQQVRNVSIPEILEVNINPGAVKANDVHVCGPEEISIVGAMDLHSGEETVLGPASQVHGRQNALHLGLDQLLGLLGQLIQRRHCTITDAL